MLLDTQYFNGTQIIGFIQDWASTGPRIKIGRAHMRVDSSCPAAISSLDEPECGHGHTREGCLVSDGNPSSFVNCAKKLDFNQNLAICFEGCIIRNE